MVTIKNNNSSDVRGNARQTNEVRDNARSNVNMEKLQSFFIKKNKNKNLKNKKYKNQNKNEKINLDMELFRYKKENKNYACSSHQYGEFPPVSEDLYGLFLQSGYISYLPNEELPPKRKSINAFLKEIPDELYTHIFRYVNDISGIKNSQLIDVSVGCTYNKEFLVFYKLKSNVLQTQPDFDHYDLINYNLSYAIHTVVPTCDREFVDMDIMGIIANAIYPHHQLMYEIRQLRLQLQSGEIIFDSGSDESYDMTDMTFEDDFDFLEGLVLDRIYNFKYIDKRSLSSLIPEHEQRSSYKLKTNTPYYINIFGDVVVQKKKKPEYKLQSASLWHRLQKSQVEMSERYIVKLVDDTLCFFKYATENVEGMSRIQIIVRACLNFLKLRFNESTYHILKDRALPHIKKIINSLNVQSFEEHLDDIRSGLSGMKNIFSSPIVSKLHQCMLYMMSLSIFDKLGISMDFLNYTAMEKAALRKKYSNVTDFFYVLCETILFIAERGYQVYKTGDMSTIFHSGGQYKKIYDTCRELTRKLPLLNNPEDHGFTESSFRADLDDVIEKLTSINKYSFCLNNQEKVVVKETLHKMSMMRDDLNTRSAARRNRKAPFGLLIYGDSGIGKTTITSMLATYFAKHEKLSTKSEFRYTVNPASKYWDGFVSSCHTLILDDVANEHPDLKDSKSLDNIIQVMNNQAFCPDQASLENKGTTPFKGKLVIATTNVKHLNAYAYFSCPSAAQRRFPFIITPRPKKQFLDERGMLCTQNIKSEPYPSLWDFDIDLVVPVPASKGRVYAKLERIHENLQTQDLLLWLHGAIEKFNLDQRKVKECIDMMEEESLCLCCTLPDSLCKNLKLQSGEVIMGYSLVLIVTLMALYATNFMFMKTNFETYIRIRNFARSYVDQREAVLKTVEKISTSEFWSTMGDKVQTYFGNKTILTAIVASVTAALVIYKISNRKETLNIQGDVSQSIGSRPEAEKNGRENVWYNNNFELSSANFTRESASSKSGTFEDFCKKIGENVVYVAVRTSETKGTSGKLLCLGGHIYLTNNHTLPNCDVSRECHLTSSSKIGLNSNMVILLSEKDIHRIPEQDLAFVTIREMPPKKKITQFFMKETSAGVFNGKYISKTSKGEIAEYNLSNIQLQKEKSLDFPAEKMKATLKLWKAKSHKPTLYGDCGAPMIVQSDFGYSILGIHMLINVANDNEVFANAIDGKFIDKLYNSLSNFNIQAGDFDLISSESVKRPVVDLHKKSVFRYMNEGTIDVYGSFTDFRGKGKSRVVDTPMSKVLPKIYKKKYTAPEMSSYEPWRIAALDLVQPITLETSILDLCIEGYVGDVEKKMNPDNIDMLMVLDDFTAINGAQVAYIDKINRSTSAGNPWKKSKKYFLEAIPPQHGMQDPVTISHKEINDRIDLIITTYLDGKRCNPNFCAHLKDEPVTFKKAKMKKTRVFTGAPFDWCVVVRKYLLSFCRLLQNERFAFEAAPGTVAQSLEWQELYDYLTLHGIHRIVAGDYKAYDKRMSPKEILAAFDIIIRLCKLSGNYTDDDLKVIRGIAEDTAFSIVDFNGDLVQMFGSNPSGNPLTVILNSIVNSLRMRYVYIILNPKNEVDSFSSNVALMTYGDDNIMSISERCDWFNHTSISEAFAKLDIVYTMADKEAVSVPFINIEDASFLKRTWRYDEDMKCMLAPLDHDSIEKMLMVWVKSKAVTEEYQGVSVMCTALQEYFFYGKDIFNDKRNMIVSLIDKLGWQDYVNKETFPTYDDLVLRFRNSSSKCSTFEECFAPQSGVCEYTPNFERNFYSFLYSIN